MSAPPRQRCDPRSWQRSKPLRRSADRRITLTSKQIGRSGRGRDVATPRVEVRFTSEKRRLVKHVEMMVLGHEFAQPINVASVDRIDETDHGSDGR
jgi:hypothetical protein